ncbi:MAG TPA: SufD family Fe-S cluster assembly protein, partial [Planctomycetota bacterium]|nr:SufD family Fe-S cluster assembly protein [Planctomycetota bacterium]
MKQMQVQPAREDPFLPDFERRERALASLGPPWLGRVRREAIDAYHRRGPPSTREEDWKYTDVSPILRGSYSPAPPASVSPDQLAEATTPGAPLLVLVNGRVDTRLSRLGRLPEGVRVQPLAETLPASPPPLETLLRHKPLTGTPFALLNTALFEDGAWIDLAARATTSAPLQVLHLAVPGKVPHASHPRLLVTLGERAQATLIETHIGIGGPAPYFTNVVTQIWAGPAAALDHYKVQRESETAYHVSSTDIRQARASQVTHHHAAFGAALARNDIAVSFNDEGAECTLNGLYMASGKRHVDTHTFVDHAKPQCTSRELYKGILDGHAQGVFYGKVVVQKDAQKTNASQSNKNLLLSETALAN